MWVLQAELQLPVSQALALFVKLIRKISTQLTSIQKAAIGASIPSALTSTSTLTLAPSSRVVGDDDVAMGQGVKAMEEELEKAGDEVTSAMKEKQRAMIDALDLSRYVLSHSSSHTVAPAVWRRTHAHTQVFP